MLAAGDLKKKKLQIADEWKVSVDKTWLLRHISL